MTLHLGKRTVPLAPWTYCYGGVCADGWPPKDLADAGSREEVRFSFPLPGWEFEVTFTETSGPCPRAITVPAERTGPRTFMVRPAGPPRSYDVTLFGRGDGGDVVTSFRWTTEISGTLPEPDGFLGIVSITGDEQFVYQPELALNDLAATPRGATALITVTAANGASRTLPELAWREKRCDYAGSVFMQGTDGTTYTGTAIYPDDEIDGSEPYAALTFDPPLPAYTGGRN